MQPVAPPRPLEQVAWPFATTEVERNLSSISECCLQTESKRNEVRLEYYMRRQMRPKTHGGA